MYSPGAETSMPSSEHLPLHGIDRAAANVCAKTIPTRKPVYGPGPIPTITSWIALPLSFELSSALETSRGSASPCSVAPS